MRVFGTVRGFDCVAGTGFLGPEIGGLLIPFRRVDVLRDNDAEIFKSQRLSYEVEETGSGEQQAVNLRIA